ncbi:trans-resveratrol di-O-methyltransferase-like [Triticum dicoccoides]|uniref:trans-resveratrol di-O-methyltransferase-like n=1 Tax=Triticum dicoccoides TaxID=85692 RepID=UPI00188E98B9|nr:trans-resveratrol di-O-methyltransferase-like [Triticum dicoccoides]
MSDLERIQPDLSSPGRGRPCRSIHGLAGHRDRKPRQGRMHPSQVPTPIKHIVMDANRDSSLATDDELLQAQAELWDHVFAYTKSMSLRCAVELGIPDAIHRRGGSITVPDLVAELSLPPSRTPYLRRLMRLLAHAGFFDAGPAPDAYGLTLLSRLLVSAPGAGQGLSPFALAMLHPIIVSPSMSLAAWFRAADDAARVPFATAHGGREFYAVVKENPEFGAAFNEAMACDGRFVMDLIVRGHGQDLFRGIASLVDVGGGSGAAARAIAAAFPHVKCSVLELPHVVASVPPGDGGVEFVAGDMFERVPKADAVLLKWILHGWGNEECVKILRRCREALPAGGRVIVMDLVVGSSPADARATETQLLWDVMMMGVVGSPERDEGEWRKIFDDAGFSGYKILAILGIRSVIEVYP